jgi:predicted O-methyltransferase YrrM
MDDRYLKVLARFKAGIEVGDIIVYRGSSGEMASNFADDSLDWIYIDGNHRHDFVKKDLELYFSKVKSTGLIAGDDYSVVGWWEGGVTRAVNEFLRTHPVDKVMIRNRQFILRKRIL